MRLATIAAACMLLLLACEPSAPPVDAAPSGSVTVVQPASAAPGASATGAPAGPSPRSLQRKVTPAAVNARLDAACTGGDAAACISLAERQDQGCGVTRKRPYPTVKQTPADVPLDREQYVRTMRRGCKLGSHDACDYRFVPRYRGVYPFEKEGKWKRPTEDPLPRAIEACQKSHDCERIYIALDRFGFTPSELAPVRAAFAKTLTDACLEGECTCGDATLYIDDSDERWLDLAILGCENGEAEGCYALARAHTTGKGVTKDDAKAAELYDVACPPLRLLSSSEREYSPRACDHLAEVAIGDSYPGKDRFTAKHYAQSACRTPGTEFDHRPCVRLAMLWATRQEPGNNRHEARMAALGQDHIGTERSYDDDCRRPSVATECAALKEALKKTR